MSGNDELAETNYSGFQYLNDKDVYMRVAQNIELIELYLGVNNKIIEETPGQNELFIRITGILR